MYTTNYRIDQILEVFNTYPRLTIADFADRAGGNQDEALRLARVMVLNNLLSQTSSTTYQLTDLGGKVIALGGYERFCAASRNVSVSGMVKFEKKAVTNSLRGVKELVLAVVSVGWVRVLMG